MARRQKADRASAPPSLPPSSLPPSSVPPSLRTPLPVVADAPTPPSLATIADGDEPDTGVFVPPTTPPAVAPRSRRSVVIGSLIALVGIGGAFAVAQQMHSRAEAEVATSTTESAPRVGDEASPPAPEAPAANDEPAPRDGDGIDLAALPDGAEATAPSSGDWSAKPTSDSAPDPKSDAAAAEPTPADKPGPNGTLAETIANAVGGDANAADAHEGETTDAPKVDGAKIPKSPPQGAVQSAVKAARAAAKACVAAADAPTQANLTFGSSGAVKSVAVSGWAAENGQSACVKSAFAGVSVGPFQDPSYTAGVVVRP